MGLMFNITLFGVLLNVSMWIIQVFGLAPIAIPAQYDPFSIINMFSLDVFTQNFLWMGVGVAAGIIVMLLRQNFNALPILVVFAVATFIPIVNKFIYAIPNMIDAIMFLYPKYNPFSEYVSGPFAGTNPFSLLFIAMGYFAAFHFLMERVTGGQIS